MGFFYACSGARAPERGSVYDPNDLSGRCGPLPAERRKHRHHIQAKVTIQPEQQHCPREYEHAPPHMCTALWPTRYFFSVHVCFFSIVLNKDTAYVETRRLDKRGRTQCFFSELSGFCALSRTFLDFSESHWSPRLLFFCC